MEEVRRDITIKGTIKKIFYHAPESDYYAFVIKSNSGKKVRAAGNCNLSLKDGNEYEITGHYVMHPKYGMQIEMIRCEEVIEKTKAGIISYLVGRNIKGVGKKLAREIYKTFGKDTIEILDNEPERLREVPGVGEVKYQAICDAWREDRVANKILAELADYGIRYSWAAKIYRHYGVNALNKIKEDPYILVHEVDGFGFTRADEIAEKFNIPRDAPVRLRAALQYVLEKETARGHCYMEKNALVAACNKEIHVDPMLIKAEVNNAVMLRTIVMEGDNCWVSEILKSEKRVAANLKKLAVSPVNKIPDEIIDSVLEEDDINYEVTQVEAIRAAVNNRVFILTGGPGTGKSTVSKAILNIFNKAGISCLLASPTGRAAKRLQETTGRPASTIHRLLQYNPELGFQINRLNPLPCSAVLIDEASMIDISLMDHLIDALPTDVRIIFVGDADQLPSVGPGNVFRDMIESGVIPMKKLQVIFRQKHDSAIIELSDDINTGCEIDENFGDNSDEVRFHTDLTSEEIKEDILERASRYLRLPGVTLYDVQVLSPQKDLDSVGVYALNEAMQEEFNRFGVEIPKTGFRVGDKVMQTKNRHMLGVFNGDVGIIRRYDRENQEFFVEFPDPEGNRLVKYDTVTSTDLQLAYASTVHKSQGAEYKYLLVAFNKVSQFLKSRNLLYTAVSRAKQHLDLYGSVQDVNGAIRNDRVEERRTHLKERLCNPKKGSGQPDPTI